jgi:hypothetical protein
MLEFMFFAESAFPAIFARFYGRDHFCDVEFFELEMLFDLILLDAVFYSGLVHCLVYALDTFVPDVLGILNSVLKSDHFVKSDFGFFVSLI